jgi:CRP-like cAMP-binding protein
VRAAVAESAFEVDAPDGEQLATEGDFGYALYAIESGTAEVSIDGASVGSLGPGDVFGEIAVIASGRRTATVTATAPLRLIALFKRDVWALEQRDPAAAASLRALVEERRAVTG